LLLIGATTTVLLALEVAYRVHMKRNSMCCERVVVSLVVAVTNQEDDNGAVAYREILVG
jgi:hypothetical protein